MIKNFTNFYAELTLYFSLFLFMDRITIDDDQVISCIFISQVA